MIFVSEYHDQKKRRRCQAAVLERIIESKSPVYLGREIYEGFLSESIRAKPCGRSCGILPGFMESGHLVLLTG